MENIQCIFCDTSSDKIVIEENGYTGRKCCSCGLIYISPRPAFTEILNLYGHDLAHISAESHISNDLSKRLYAKHNLKIIKGFIKNGSMLEIGAGAGFFLDEARKEGFDVYAIEFNHIQAEYIRNNLRIPCEESPLDVSLFNNKKFDIIYHCDVISHFYDPISEFQKMHDKLGKNGIIVFETGNFGAVEEKYYRFISKFQYPDHLFFFSENNLKQLLERTGFEFIKIYRYSILLQLMMHKILVNVPGFMSVKEKTKSTGDLNGSLNSSNNKYNLKQISKNVYHYLSYFIRYKIGYLMPLNGRPQTVIVIARKKN